MRTHNLLTSGDGTRGAQVGLDQRLHRGCGRQPGLRLDHHRQDLRRLCRGRHHPVRPGRLHARGAVGRSRALPAQLGAARALQQHHDRLGHAAQRHQEVGRADRGLGPPPRRALRRATRSRPGPGSAGTSPTATTGRARSPSTARCTTRPSRPCGASCPSARVGGPHTCGAFNNEKAQTFLRGFLQHVSDTGTPLDFVGFHAKGKPVVHEGHVRMGLAQAAPRHRDQPRDHQRVPQAQGRPRR